MILDKDSGVISYGLLSRDRQRMIDMWTIWFNSQDGMQTSIPELLAYVYLEGAIQNRSKV